MSGMTRSMPSISSSGNMRPASMTTMSSPDSIASMFFPISPTPPSGMTRSGLAKERDLLRRPLRLFGLGLGSGRSREVEGERGEVREERVAKRGLVKRRRRVVDGEDDEPVLKPRLAVDARDGFAREELAHRVPAQRHDDPRAQHLEVSAKPDVAGGDLVRERVAIFGRPVPDDVRDEHLPPVEADPGEELVQELARGADERLALHVLVVPGGLAQEEQAGLAGAVAGDGLAGASVERAGPAGTDLGGDSVQVHRGRIVHRARLWRQGGCSSM